jgi:hypothetical protein
VGPLDVVLGLLESRPWPVRCRFGVCRAGRRATVAIHRAGNEVGLLEHDDGTVEVVCEHAPHQVTRERVPAGVAAQLVLALVQAGRLIKIDLPGDSWGAANEFARRV